MTREKAVKVSRALDNVEGFEIFIDEVLTAADNARDTCDVEHFIPKLRRFLEEELKVRNEVLANL